MKRIALLTEESQPHGIEDDKSLREAFKTLGVQAENVPWESQTARWGDFDRVLIRTPWGYYLEHQTFLARLKHIAKLTPLWNPLECVEWNIDKTYLRDFERSGVSIVPTLFIKEPQALPTQEEIMNLGNEIVIKPSIAAGSDLTYRLKSEAWETFDRKLIAQILKRASLMIQPFLPSIATEGEVSLLYWNDKGSPSFQYSVLKLPKQGDYRVQPDYGGDTTSMGVDDSFKRFGSSVLAKLKTPWLYARVDVLNWKTSPILGELELIEPQLFLRFQPSSAMTLAKLFMEA